MMGMMPRVAGLLAAPRVVFLSGVAFVVAFWLVNVSGVPGLLRSEALGRVGILDMDYGYTPEQAYAKLVAYGLDGRAAYVQFLTHVDFVYPAVVGLFLCTATLAAVRRAFPTRPRLQVGIIPVALIVCDWAENAAILGLLGAYPEAVPRLARLASIVTVAKGVAGVGSVAVLACTALLLLLRLLTQRSGRRLKGQWGA